VCVCIAVFESILRVKDWKFIYLVSTIEYIAVIS